MPPKRTAADVGTRYVTVAEEGGGPVGFHPLNEHEDRLGDAPASGRGFGGHPVRRAVALDPRGSGPARSHGPGFHPRTGRMPQGVRARRRTPDPDGREVAMPVRRPTVRWGACGRRPTAHRSIRPGRPAGRAARPALVELAGLGVQPAHEEAQLLLGLEALRAQPGGLQHLQVAQYGLQHVVVVDAQVVDAGHGDLQRTAREAGMPCPGIRKSIDLVGDRPHGLVRRQLERRPRRLR